MLRAAIDYPRSDERWLRRLGIGGVAILGSFLIVPLFVFFGYVVRVLRSVASGRDAPPNFDEVGSLAVDGVKFCGIAFAYALPAVLIPVFAGALGEALGLGASVAGADPGAGPITVGAVGLLLLGSVVVGVVSVYSMPAAVSHFAYTGSARAAFDVGTVVKTVGLSKPYGKAYLLTVAVGIALSPVVAVFSVVLVGAFVAVYQTLVAGYLVGTGYAVSRDLPRDGRPDDAKATRPGTGSRRVADAGKRDEAGGGSEGSIPGGDVDESEGGTCSECGRSVGSNAAFCPDCGAAIPRDDEATPGEDDEPRPATHAAGEGTQNDTGASPPAPESEDRLYTDETGTTYVKTSIGPDKRLHADGDGNHYYQRGTAMRAVSAGFAAVCVGFALFALVALPDAPGGPSSPRGRFLFALVESVPFGNVILGLVAVWVGYRLAHIAYTGREYVSVEGAE